MENSILTSECFWCGERWIKERIGVSHGCDAEKNAKNEQVHTPEQEQIIDLMKH